MEEKNLPSKTFCVYPWIHQFIDANGLVKPCCIYDHMASLGSLKENSLKEIWNNEKTKQLRLDFLNGREVPECYRCFNKGNQTYRVAGNQIFYSKDYIKSIVDNTNADGSIDEHKLFYMDVRFNNLCNFTCRTCTPHFSTSWLADHEKLYGPSTFGFQYPGKTEDNAFKEMELHFDNIESIYFAGGEPLMQKEHYQVLEKLIELEKFDVKIRYNTNFSRLVTNKVDIVKYWQKFKNITVHASIDGSHAKGEYWRKGTKWAEIVSNRKRIISECNHIDFALTTTVSWVNVFNILELHEEWVSKHLIDVNGMFINCLDDPDYYSLKNIPDWKKEKIQKQINSYGKSIIKLYGERASIMINRFNMLIDFMMDKSYSKDVDLCLKNFEKLNGNLDIIRNENFYKIFPEHKDIKKYLATLA